MLHLLLKSRNETQLLLTYKGLSSLNSTLLPFLHKPLSSTSTSTSCSSSSLLSASKKIKIHPQNSETTAISFAAFFKTHGFTDPQIANIRAKFPRLQSRKLEKIIKPKLDYFLSSGFSPPELADFISSNPQVLSSSLEKRIKPNFILLTSLLRGSLLVPVAVRRSCRLLQYNLSSNFLPNIETLRSKGVPDSSVSKLITSYPRVVMTDVAQFSRVVESVSEMGFNPLSMMFVHGIHSMAAINPSTWQQKVEILKSLGWSGGDIVSAFIKQPFFMMKSEKKLRKIMGFFVGKLHLDPTFLVQYPILFLYSLEKRIMPRYAVMSVLASKGFLKADLGKSFNFIFIGEKDFINNYVIKYQHKVPGLLEAYKGELDHLQLEGGKKLL